MFKDEEERVMFDIEATDFLKCTSPYFLEFDGALHEFGKEYLSGTPLELLDDVSYEFEYEGVTRKFLKFKSRWHDEVYFPEDIIGKYEEKVITGIE